MEEVPASPQKVFHKPTQFAFVAGVVTSTEKQEKWGWWIEFLIRFSLLSWVQQGNIAKFWVKSLRLSSVENRLLADSGERGTHANAFKVLLDKSHVADVFV